MITSEEFFTRLEKQLEKGLPFVAYRKPELSETPENTFAFLQEDKAAHRMENFNDSGFVFAPFDDREENYLIPADAAERLETTYHGIEAEEKDMEQEDVEFPPVQLEKKERVAHEELVQKAVDFIEGGIFKKVVVSRREKVETQLEAISIFKTLLKKYKNAFVYLWFHPETDTWMGATPETLLSVERNRFSTMALAGTQAFIDTTDVEWGEKEKEEQQIVTDFILDSLKEVGIEQVETAGPYTARAGNLLHLRTNIIGSLGPSRGAEHQRSESSNLKQIVKALHPTPAVCGLPREAAKKFILENENYDREFYTGFLGELNLKTEIKRNNNRRNQENQAYASILNQTSLYVNLRCLKLDGGIANIYVGGGITKDSKPSQEWEETENKSQTMKSVLVK